MDQLKKMPRQPEKKSKFTLIPVENNLKSKTRLVSTQHNAEQEVLARADAAIEKLSAQFDDWLQDDLLRLKNARDTILEQGLCEKTKNEIYIASHELKGLAATFGYPLVGKIAFSLCLLIESMQDLSAIPVSVIEQHVDAMIAIVNKNARLEGNGIAQTLTKRLCDVTYEYIVETTGKRTA